MIKFGKWLIVFYAILMLGGGLGGFLSKKHSVPSLISGIVSALLYAGAYSMLAKSPKKAYTLSAGIAAVLTLVFIERTLKTLNEPSGMMRNVGLAVFSVVVAGIFAVCIREATA